MLRTLAISALGLALVASAATAQNDKAQSPPVKAEQSESEHNASATGMWQSSKLIGLNVYNASNKKIGDIKEIMLDKQGKADLVVIGVGGFLGMGERDVAVKFGEIKWSDKPVSSANSANTRRSATTGSSANNTSAKQKQNYPDHAVFNADKDQLKKMPQFNYNK